MMVLEKPNKEQLDLIFGEFKTTQEAVQRDVRILIEWLEKQPHLPNVTGERLFAIVIHV